MSMIFTTSELNNLLLLSPKAPQIPKTTLCITTVITIASDYLQVEYHRTTVSLRISTLPNRKITTIAQLIDCIYLHILKFKKNEVSYNLLDENLDIYIYNHNGNYSMENNERVFHLKRSNENQEDQIDKAIKMLTVGKQIYIRDLKKQ